MKKKTLLLFDLDGTVIDSGAGIKIGINHAFAAMGYPTFDPADMDPFLGPPLTFSFGKFGGIRPEDIPETIRIYREYYKKEGGMFLYSVYPGIPEMLRRLRSAGYRTAIATSKPQPYAETILAHAHLSDLLDEISGAGLDDKDTKTDVIRRALERTGTPAEDAVMIGDRRYDILGTKEVGMDSIGITYGYGDRPELASAGADLIFDTVQELEEYLLKA